MNTKTFAQKARNILMDGVAKKLLYWGFNPEGKVVEEPEKVSGGYMFRGDAFDDPNVPILWRSLKNAISKKGIDVIKEEAAYTWFNRIMAIRILAKNGYDLPQLQYAEGLNNTPIILQKARQEQYDFLNAKEKTRLERIIGDYNKEKEAFGLLLTGYCHSHKTLNTVFGKLDDYTELLLPDNMLQEQGFLHLLNTTDAISEKDYKEVELIGWLYQFYISERKKEVFKAFDRNVKAEPIDIPAATQIFTPNWIVKYMVENTAGKIWLDHKPNSPLKAKMKYLVTNEQDTIDRNDSDAISSGNKEMSPRSWSRGIITDIEQLTLMDPACGSGHILVEGFELLYQMYLEEFYTPEEAVQSIFEKNLFGLDIDDRAVQLSKFSVLLKAAQVYPDVWEKDWHLNIYAMPEANSFSKQEVADFLGEPGEEYIEALEKALNLMQDAKNLGSVMQIGLKTEAVDFINQRYDDLTQDNYLNINLESIVQRANSFIPILLALSRKYTAVVANPPYMKNGNMNHRLKNYIERFYPVAKYDLYATFILVVSNLLEKNFYGSLITQQSWMFTSRYEGVRKYIIENSLSPSIIHLGVGTFGADFGTASFIIKPNSNKRNKEIKTIFFDVSKVFDVEQKRLRFINDKDIIRSNYSLSDFSVIPKKIFAYRLSKDNFELFKENNFIDTYGVTREGLTTGDNKKFLRVWSEISKLKINEKWFPYVKGGNYRKWYGNYYLVINWENDGIKVKNNKTKTGRVRSHNYNGDYGLLKGISWGAFSSRNPSFRYVPSGFYFDSKGSMLFLDNNKDLYPMLSYLNSNVSINFLDSISENRDTKPGTISKLPYKKIDNKDYKKINLKTKFNVEISIKDWDSRETSWDFKQSPLLNQSNSLVQAYKNWKLDVTQDFFQLHCNEEELNRIFIDIYGLQDELTPEVALKDITILQEELNAKDLEALEPQFRAEGAAALALPIDKAEVMQQFISYGVGLFMGRYRLDKLGLNIAHPNPTQEEKASYNSPFGGKGAFTIDEDAILPLMGTKANFKDDIFYQIQQLLDTIWGASTRTENLNFLQDGLNKDLEKYLVKDFWKCHCKMYKKKPIYWLFSSKKGAFQVLVYMHRMNAFTVEKIRANYLIDHIKQLNAEIETLDKNSANLTVQQSRHLDQLRKDLKECEEYDMELKDKADQQITFDLDDGVTENYKLFEPVVAKIK